MHPTFPLPITLTSVHLTAWGPKAGTSLAVTPAGDRENPAKIMVRRKELFYEKDSYMSDYRPVLPLDKYMVSNES